jgi:hypothetical protein
MNPRPSAFAALAMAALLAACGEISQDGPKPFAGPDETRSYAGEPFNGDRALYDRSLAERTRTQDEYLEMGERDGGGPNQAVARSGRP